MRRHACAAFCCLALALALPVAADDGYLDFRDRMTEICEVQGVRAAPPPGWFNVPVDSRDPKIRGCQMMRTGEDEGLAGILRLMSVDATGQPVHPPWADVLVSMEVMVMNSMGMTLGERQWVREDVPVSGLGQFGGGRAVGFASTIRGNDIPQESHFLVFEEGPVKYIISLHTPARDALDGSDYRANTQGMAALMQGLALPEGDPRIPEAQAQ